jgi:hypothetical protein
VRSLARLSSSVAWQLEHVLIWRESKEVRVSVKVVKVYTGQIKRDGSALITIFSY